MYTVKNNIFIGFNETQTFKSLVELWSGKDTSLPWVRAPPRFPLFFPAKGGGINKGVEVLQRAIIHINRRI